MSVRAPREVRRVRMLVTPEGVPLPLELADAGQRAGAFLIDACIIVGLFIAITLAFVFAGAAIDRQDAWRAIGLLWTIGLFLLRNAYFTGFESRPRGATPGKRAIGLRVIARDGGRLTLDAVIARNAMREVEVFLPLMFVAELGSWSEGRGWIGVFGLGWSALFLFLPLMNRDRLRAGDLLAGTWVIRVPKCPLLPEIAAAPDEQAFTATELDAYGVHELETLERVIRERHVPAIETVANTIALRIGRRHWSDDGGSRDLAFLEAYYAALRARLEQKLLFGERRADKNDRD